MSLQRLSAIIPLGPAEDQLELLLDDLLALPESAEVILAVCDSSEIHSLSRFRHHAIYNRLRLVSSTKGRAIQQNTGAAAARHDFLWFLHADTRITPHAIEALETSLNAAPHALHYFHLKFGKQGALPAMCINEWGARFRSQILGIPFGDQAFCLHRDEFKKIGGFPENALYGEDHLLIWFARQANIKIRCTRQAVTTSARKYRQYGWGKLTFKYQYMWVKQAMPQLCKLLCNKVLTRR